MTVRRAPSTWWNKATRQATEQDKVKHRYLSEWSQAVNAHGGFMYWRCAVTKEPREIRDILIKNDAIEEL
ncbi:hypothetical protein DK28_0210665 [Peptococcaceae bacterium SCADC1_2_3]|jgi:16S rRNA C967 or C1407 C5-methylase (RsmB/RsmF family)|nr:hypothetical protein DK28_0210665 [Peptococcaceae bacterium SCADC1_2_3]KFI35769.1 hypothetical protein HY00_01720 [Peptococcaceae bacterium SCADC1_2_3]